MESVLQNLNAVFSYNKKLDFTVLPHFKTIQNSTT